MLSKAFSKSTNTTYIELFHSWDCSCICRSTNMWSVHGVRYLKPACSWRNMFSTVSVIRCKFLAKDLASKVEYCDPTPVVAVSNVTFLAWAGFRAAIWDVTSSPYILNLDKLQYMGCFLSFCFQHLVTNTILSRCFVIFFYCVLHFALCSDWLGPFYLKILICLIIVR